MSDKDQQETPVDVEPVTNVEQKAAEQEARTRRKGIYLLPNLLTTGAMFSGFYAILAGMDGNFEAAAIAIFVAMVFDARGREADRTPRVYPWMNEPADCILLGWMFILLRMVFISFSTMLFGSLNTGGGY